MAIIGSSTNTGRSERSSGSDSMYGVGCRVSSLRASPTKPIWASGISLCAWSAMPSPARSTGTSSGGLASQCPSARATGVWMRSVRTGASRMAS